MDDKKNIVIDLREIYKPQRKQLDLHRCKANEILFGGSAGPGKSHSLRHEALHWCLTIANLHVYLFRRTYGELEDNHILPSIREFPQQIGTYKKQNRRWEFKNGSMLHFCHCQHDSDVAQYQGSEIHLLIIDELTSFTEAVYDFLRGRVRSALKIPREYRHKIPGIICATNPGGVGHNWVKRNWVDFCKINLDDYPKMKNNRSFQTYLLKSNGKQVAAYKSKKSPLKEGGMLRAYIPAVMEDNKVLMATDPMYRHRVDAMQEPLRTAWLTGDWDIFLGQAFNFSPTKHICKPYPVPEHAPLYMTYDWGYMRPFSIGWWWEDGEHRLYRFSEWYGWNGQPDGGVRYTDEEVVFGIIEREKQLGISDRNIYRLCDPTCFNKKPDYKGGGQGPSTYEVFMKNGITLVPGDANRKLKVRQFHQRLREFDDETPPMVQIYPNCEHFIRTIPLLQSDPISLEDVDTKGEDHCYDESCHVFMSRPIDQESLDEKMKEEEWETYIETKLDSSSRMAARHVRKLIQEEVDKDGFEYLDY